MSFLINHIDSHSFSKAYIDLNHNHVHVDYQRGLRLWTPVQIYSN